MKIVSGLFVIGNLQNEKCDFLHSFPTEVEGVRIVVILFRNIAKNYMYNPYKYIRGNGYHCAGGAGSWRAVCRWKK